MPTPCIIVGTVEINGMPSAAAELRNGFTDAVATEGRYNFSIKTVGWYHVDAYMEGLPGTMPVDLFVRRDLEDIFDVHVFFPGKKLLTVGVFYEKYKLYHFEKYNEQISFIPG